MAGDNRLSAATSNFKHDFFKYKMNWDVYFFEEPFKTFYIIIWILHRMHSFEISRSLNGMQFAVFHSFSPSARILAFRAF